MFQYELLSLTEKGHGHQDFANKPLFLELSVILIVRDSWLSVSSSAVIPSSFIKTALTFIFADVGVSNLFAKKEIY